MKAIRQTALSGSSRQAIQSTETGTPVDDLMAHLREGESERKLLLAAGAADVYLQAGKAAQPGAAVPERAPEERLPICSRAGHN